MHVNENKTIKRENIRICSLCILYPVHVKIYHFYHISNVRIAVVEAAYYLLQYVNYGFL